MSTLPASPDGPAETSAETSAEDSAGEQEPEWKRRRRLAAVFGDAVPEQTSDDRDPREPAAGKGDDWYRAEVPPHHG